MDNIKDIYGHITDRVYKLTAALYRVTELMSDKEPLKWTLRDMAVVIHDSVVSVKITKDKDRVLNEALDSAYRVIKTLELVSSGSGISSINFEILKREYIYVKNFLEGKKSDLSYDPKILPEFIFSQKRVKETASKSIDFQPVFSGQSIVGPMSIEGVSDIIIGKEEGREIDTQSRKGKILNFLKDGEARSVGEVASIFNGGASDKAVQRDLFDLVRIGKIAAKGDKRWRKYEILKNA